MSAIDNKPGRTASCVLFYYYYYYRDKLLNGHVFAAPILYKFYVAKSLASVTNFIQINREKFEEWRGIIF